MGKQIAVTENGKHKIGKKLLLTDENKIHRKVRKAFLTRNGVHRLVYSSGTRWKKYDCDESSEFGGYVEVSTNSSGVSVGDTDTSQWWSITYHSDYIFSSAEGFISAGYWGQASTVNELGSVSGYIIYTEEVWEIVSVDVLREYGDGSFTAEVTMQLVALCEPGEENTIYVQGSTYYGEYEAEEGVLPEEGTLVEGSATDSYCIIDVDDTYYYYVRGD